MGVLPTVKVAMPGDPLGIGYRTINETDFDPAVHQLYRERGNDPEPILTSDPEPDPEPIVERQFRSPKRR